MIDVGGESPEGSKRDSTAGKWTDLFQISALCGLVIAFAIVFSVALLKWIPDWIRYEYGPDIFTSLFHPSRTEQVKKLRLDLATSERELDLRQAELSKLSESNPRAAELKEQILRLRVAVYRVEFQLKELGVEPPARIPPNPYRHPQE